MRDVQVLLSRRREQSIGSSGVAPWKRMRSDIDTRFPGTVIVVAIATWSDVDGIRETG
jgi:hypothetical protein